MSPITKEFSNLKFQKQILLDFTAKQEERVKTLLEKALSTAETAHKGQFRDEGIPYVIHPIRVANTLIELKTRDYNLLIAALLHDVVEDGDVSLSDIKNDFGEKVAKLVDTLTRKRSSDETEEQKRENKVKKFQELMDVDKDMRLIKCADLLDNIRSWFLIPPDNPSRKKFPRWFNEAEKYYIPMADKTDKRLAEKMRDAFDFIRDVSKEK